MHDFLQVNSGLQSRIPTTFDFEDYSPDEIVEIGLLGLRKQGYQVNEALYGEIVKGNYMRANDHSMVAGSAILMKTLAPSIDSGNP